MIKSMVYFGHISIGEVELSPKGETNVAAAPWVREIRVDRLSPPSERCLPLAVLHTVSSGALCFVMESRPSPATADNEPPSSLVAMHTACLRDNKTAVFPLGAEEIHLVAMKPKSNLPNHACFWGYKVPLGLYSSCLSMLNLRCLGIVFDLDETLIVANTTRSFEDRIDALQRKLSKETDPQRISGMLAEIKRYQEDRTMLKQYIDGDQVIDGGKMYKVQSEVVPPLADNHQPMIRPVIRLQDKSIILTRINPSIRDTSVLVRLRPAWDDLRSYLIARGRKRFEVYVCTMAERDYALEMWRLLDPDSRLINSVQLPHRLVCVKSGSKKSLLNVFHDGSCHPGMALVIDDRLKVWEEKDQCRVHVVPAFSPYYAPQAEANFPIPVLCVARNVACNVRGSFFKEFDEGLLPSISEVHFDDELDHVPSSPDVGNYLISEDENAASLNVNKDPMAFDGMADAEVERRMKEAVCSVQAADPVTTNVDVISVAANQQFATSSSIPLAPPLGVVPLNNDQGPQPPSVSWPDAQSGMVDPLQGSPAREEGEVPESELDPDTRRRLLILQHGQDTRDPTPPFAAEPSVQASVPPVQSQGNWFPVEDEMDPRNLNRTSTDFHLESDAVHSDKSQPPHQPYFPARDNPIFSDRLNHQNQRYSSQLPHSEDRQMLQNQAPTTYRSFSGEDMATQRFHPGNRSSQMESGRQFVQYTETSGAVLEEIAAKCGFKVEYRSTLCDTTELRFSIQIWIVGEKVGEGMGRTRKEAQRQAANISLRNLADRFLSFDPDKMTVPVDDGFSSNPNSFKYRGIDGDNIVPVASTSDGSRYMHERVDNSTKSAGSVAALKELCTAEGYNLVFQAQPSPSDSLRREEVHAQIEIGGQILGKGVGVTWEEAKAADGALGTLRYMLGQRPQKRSGSPRSFASNYNNKRYKPDFQPMVQRIPSGRYSRNDSRVP
ncbi:hypothetical protein CFC21_018088 [Triticum aestivum]|uniref:Uncharacterized protein n=3 Tax=Triticum TaxID=4564 RepID=A0A9R1NZZ1_TRITD|nr:RNA polymerase II C-terminal domain phosphatase-like 1 isoform X2 [Triticum aestivum]KAF7002626.1 hypothetical protein CFC21_018088 [Triticum aestivum]VAH34324.1 unnamed protein product [Triticum turgidum subsp. durum]